MADFGLAAQYQNNNNDILLSWSKIYPGPYSIYVSDFVDGPWTLIKTTEAGAFLYSNASNNKYFFQVFSSKFKPNTSIKYSSNIAFISPSQNTDVEDAGHFIRGKINLGQSFLSLVDDPTNSQVILSWHAVANASYYGLYRLNNTTRAYDHVGDTQATSLGDSTPYISAQNNNSPVYTYYVIPATPTLFGPQSNGKDYYLASNIGVDPVLGPPFPPTQYSMSVEIAQPRLAWNLPELGTGYPRVGGFTQDTGQQIIDLVYWHSQDNNVLHATGTYAYGINSGKNPRTVFVPEHNYILATFGDGSGSIGSRPLTSSVMLVNDAGGGVSSSYIGGVVIVFSGGNPSGSQSAFYDANDPLLITGFSLYAKDTPFTSSEGLPEGTLIATIPASSSSYSDFTTSPVYYRLIGHTTYFDYLYNDVSLLSGYNYYSVNTTVQTSVNILPDVRASMADAVIGGNIYLYGGRTSNAQKSNIWVASVDSPTVVSDTGKNLPIALAGQRVVVISGSMYMYGGVNSVGTPSNVILTASISDPTTWITSSNILPAGLIEPAVFVTNQKIWMIWGGANGNAPTSKVYTASVNSPTVFSLAGDTGISLVQMSIVQLGNNLYAYGGQTILNNYPFTVYSASKSNPISWSSTAATYPQGSPNPVIAVGDRHYRFGGDIIQGSPSTTSSIYNFSYLSPLAPTSSGFGIAQSDVAQNIVAYTSSTGAPFIVMYGGGGPMIAINTIQTVGVDTGISASGPVYDYSEMQTWKRLIPVLA